MAIPVEDPPRVHHPIHYHALGRAPGSGYEGAYLGASGRTLNGDPCSFWGLFGYYLVIQGVYEAYIKVRRTCRAKGT